MKLNLTFLAMLRAIFFFRHVCRYATLPQSWAYITRRRKEWREWENKRDLAIIYIRSSIYLQTTLLGHSVYMKRNRKSFHMMAFVDSAFSREGYFQEMKQSTCLVWWCWISFLGRVDRCNFFPKNFELISWTATNLLSLNNLVPESTRERCQQKLHQPRNPVLLD